MSFSEIKICDFLKDRKGAILSIVLIACTFILIRHPSNGAHDFLHLQDSAIQSISLRSKQVKFVSAAWASTNEVWLKLFREQLNKQYVEPKLVFYSGKTATCQSPDSLVAGSFYCNTEKAIYIDLGFYNELQARFPSMADVAMAYIIAHETGHHIQNLLGYQDIVGEPESGTNEIDDDALALSLELQADFYAGTWVRNNRKMKNFMVNEDIDKVLYAASVVGEEQTQKRQLGYKVPDSFTHGSSAERFFWFKKGFETGDISQADTFKYSKP